MPPVRCVLPWRGSRQRVQVLAAAFRLSREGPVAQEAGPCRSPAADRTEQEVSPVWASIPLIRCMKRDVVLHPLKSPSDLGCLLSSAQVAMHAQNHGDATPAFLSPRRCNDGQKPVTLHSARNKLSLSRVVVSALLDTLVTKSPFPLPHHSILAAH